MDRRGVRRVRSSEANRFSVYRRSKRIENGRIGYLDKLEEDNVGSNCEVAAHCGGIVDKLEELGFRNGEEEIEIEVKEKPMAVFTRRFTRSALKLETSGEVEIEVEEKPMAVLVKRDGPRRFTRSALKLNEEDSIMETERDGDSRDRAVSKKKRLNIPANKMEMNMSNKNVTERRPTTVRELFETGLVEGYPVFYNDGKRGFPLRGTIKDAGIACSCTLCNGVRVLSPRQFEFHACKSYRHGAKYICLENGKSLLDVVKECRKSSVKTLQKTIQNFIGPMPAKKQIICQNCEGSSLATLTTKSDQICDSCTILANSDADTECVKSRHLELTSDTDSPGKSSVHISARKMVRLKTTETLSRPNSLPRTSQTESSPISAIARSSWKITKKDQRMHKLVFEEGGLPDGTELVYYFHGQKMRDGYKMGSGIFCHCCNAQVSPSQFEAHAGFASRRKPYMNIYTSNGVSLHEFAVSLLKGREFRAMDNDDLCIICMDGGELVLCDGCPRAFHKECASLSGLPQDKWYCTYCENKFERISFVEWNVNARAAGRVRDGTDPIQEIINRCVRQVKKREEAEVIACSICRGCDFSKSGFGPRTVIICDQCEKEYHVGCLEKHKIADLKEIPEGKWFCCGNCKSIYSKLQSLLSESRKLPEPSIDVIKKKQKERNLDADSDLDVRWRILNGNFTSRDTRSLSSEAVSIFHECFSPIVDSDTGDDFIPTLVYGRKIGAQDFGGTYCAVLTVNLTVVSAVIFRVFGEEIAEIPLVATRDGEQKKGYVQALILCIENLLADLKVKKCVLPAAEDTKSMWIEKFGFEIIPEKKLSNYREAYCQMFDFTGTSMLEKPVPKLSYR